MSPPLPLRLLLGAYRSRLAGTQSTEGTEASHMRSKDDGVTEEAFNRGYELWLLTEAKKRNPGIKTMGLSWGAPGWIGNGSTADNPGRNGTLFFTEDNIDYHVKWVQGLKQYHNVTLDWMGIWNESPFSPDWIVALRAALDARLPAADAKALRIVASDNVRWGANNSNFPTGNGNICEVCLRNATVRAAVGAVGTHYGWDGPGGIPCQQLREAHGIPLMVTEGHQNGQVQAYVAGNITGYGQWPLFDGYYPVTPYSSYGGPARGGTGVQAREPWTGYWGPGPTGVRSSHAVLSAGSDASQGGNVPLLPTAFCVATSIKHADFDDPHRVVAVFRPRTQPSRWCRLRTASAGTC